MSSNTGLIIGVVVIVIVIITLVLVGILVGVYAGKNEIEKILSGSFFISTSATSRQLLIPTAGPTGPTGPTGPADTVVVSNSTNNLCTLYTWTLTNNKLQNSGYKTGNYVISSDSNTDGSAKLNTNVKMILNTNSNDGLSQWKYKADGRWCLLSNENYCLYNNNGQIQLRDGRNSLDARFFFLPETAKTESTICRS